MKETYFAVRMWLAFRLYYGHCPRIFVAQYALTVTDDDEGDRILTVVYECARAQCARAQCARAVTDCEY